MIYYKHFPENSCWDTSSAVSYGFQECSLSGEVIKNLPLPSDKSSYRGSFLNLIFQSLNQIWVKYLNIKVWMEFYKCMWSAKKTKQLWQVFLQWVNAQLCYTWPQLPKAKWEKPVALPVVWRKNYIYFKSSERLAPGLKFQSISKKIFAYSLMFSLNAHTREDTLSFFQTIYVHCPDGSCTALNTPVAVEEVKETDWSVGIGRGTGMQHITV